MPKGLKGFQKGHKIRLGILRSKKVKEKIKETLKGRVMYQMTDEIRKKMGKRQMGAKNHNWKGGIAPKNKLIRHSIEFRLWREAVFARDNWTCQKCEEKGGELHPHHIQNFADYPELRFAIDNGITFCKECHLEFHKIYGKKNNNESQSKGFIKSIRKLK